MQSQIDIFASSDLEKPPIFFLYCLQVFLKYYCHQFHSSFSSQVLPSSFSYWTSCIRKPLLGATSLASFTWIHEKVCDNRDSRPWPVWQLVWGPCSSAQWGRPVPEWQTCDGCTKCTSTLSSIEIATSSGRGVYSQLCKSFLLIS